MSKVLTQSQSSVVFADATLAEVVDFIAGAHEINISLDVQVRRAPVTIAMKDVTVAQALNAIADAHDLVFIVRDYGVFGTTPERALSVPGPSIPAGVPYYPARNRPMVAPLRPVKLKEFKFDAPVPERVELHREIKMVPPVETPQAAPAPVAPEPR